MRRGVSFEFPYDKENFRDRYTRQARNGPCSTIVAHMSKDGLMFIHPTQDRSLTPREAARVQSFPDWFEFPASQTHQFKLIGNAVPPLIAEALGNAVDSYLRAHAAGRVVSDPVLQGFVPSNIEEATDRLVGLVNVADKKQLFRMAREEFLRGWCSIGFLYPDLHPDSALEDGTRTSGTSVHARGELGRIAPRLAAPHYVHSGWPVAVVPVVREAWRRYQAKQFTEQEFYCSEAVLASIRCRHESTKVRSGERQRALA